ncbi:MAG: cytochrome P450 [Proteobacteria bacterium]|nr:cytochrome P450 [Pseudomonadota bacterium]
MPFIEAFYNETMRLKPVAPRTPWSRSKTSRWMVTSFLRGTIIMMLTRRIAVDDARFGHAAEFDPDRWPKSEAERGCPHDTTAFVPFGSGPRFCPGRNLALLEIRTVLATLCRNFDVGLVDSGRAVEELLAFTMMPKNLEVRLANDHRKGE